jgi:hypothetical protein
MYRAFDGCGRRATAKAGSTNGSEFLVAVGFFSGGERYYNGK